MKKEKIIAIIFIIFLLALAITVITMEFISKSKGIIVLDSSNIEETLKNKNTFGQKFKIEADSYEVVKEFYVGTSYSSDIDTSTYYDNTYFIIHILDEDSDGYYMAARIKNERDEDNPDLSSLRDGYTIDLVGMVSDLDTTYGETNVRDEFFSSIDEEKNILEYCINVE